MDFSKELSNDINNYVEFMDGARFIKSKGLGKPYQSLHGWCFIEFSKWVTLIIVKYIIGKTN